MARHGAVTVLLLLLATPAWAQRQSGPQVTITQPTTATTFSTTQSPLTLAGTASAKGNRPVRSVSWRTDRGAQGTAQGTTAWTFGVTLPVGTTVLTVTATDSRGGTGLDRLTVTVQGSPPPAGPITLEWRYSGSQGDAFEIERCLVRQGTCGPVAPVASVAITTRTWQDTTADSQIYGYQVVAMQGGMVLGVSKVCIVNTPCPP